MTDLSIQCRHCGRDAVPRAWVNDRAEVYCTECFDPEHHTDETAANINSTDEAVVAFAKMLHGGGVE
jgi:hypothetical protein